MEVVDPIALSAKIVESDNCCCGCNCDSCNENTACEYSTSLSSRMNLTSRVAVPQNIGECFDDDLIIDDDARQILVTLGLFTIVKLERSVQLLINAIDFCVPEKECCAAEESNPCDLFNSIRFPIDEFFPAISSEDNFIGNCGNSTSNCCCGNSSSVNSNSVNSNSGGIGCGCNRSR